MARRSARAPHFVLAEKTYAILREGSGRQPSCESACSVAKGYQTYLVIYCLFIGSIWDPGLLYSLGYYLSLGYAATSYFLFFPRSFVEFLVVRVSVLAF